MLLFHARFGRIYLYICPVFLTTIPSSFLAVHGYLRAIVVGCIRTDDEFDVPLSLSPLRFQSTFWVLLTSHVVWYALDLWNRLSRKRLQRDSKGSRVLVIRRRIGGHNHNRQARGRSR